MQLCPDCLMPLELEVDEALDNLDGVWCDCPVLKADPYIHDPEEEEPNEPEW